MRLGEAVGRVLQGATEGRSISSGDECCGSRVVFRTLDLERLLAIACLGRRRLRLLHRQPGGVPLGPHRRVRRRRRRVGFRAMQIVEGSTGNLARFFFGICFFLALVFFLFNCFELHVLSLDEIKSECPKSGVAFSG